MATLFSYNKYIEVDDSRWVAVRNPNPGDKLLLRQKIRHIAKRDAEWQYECVKFIREYITKDHPIERHRVFESIGGDGRPYEWEAYKYNGRWCLGSSADAFSLGRIQTDTEVRRTQVENQRKDILRQINRRHLKLERIKAEIAEMETRRADLAIELTELQED